MLMIKRVLAYNFLLIMATAALAAAQTFGPADAIDRTGSGMINWTTNEVYATGIGAPPPHPVNAAQARAMAERAAFVVALRNLLETVKGVRVDSESIVENFMTRSDVIRTKVDGLVKGARTVKTQYLSDGSVEVLVALSMKGEFLNAIVPETFGKVNGLFTPAKPAPQITKPLPPAVPGKKTEPIKPVPQQPTSQPIAPVPSVPLPKPEPDKPAPQTEKKTEPAQPEPSKPAPEAPSQATVAFKGGVATGMVIDGRGLGLRPALLPRIVDQQGQELYVGQVVPRTNAVEQGVAGYARDVQAAANNFRVTDNPAVIKAVRVSGNARTDVVINQGDAQAFRELGNKGDFLKYCRVIIVY
jgi:hypothetical protein